MVAFDKTTFTALAAATAQLFNIVDFEGHFLDLAFSTMTDGNPIIGQTPNNPPTSNQQWLVNFQVNQVQAQIQNALGPFLSYPTASTGGQLEFAPAASSLKDPLTFNINFVAGGGTTITEVKTGLALTAWESVSNISTVSPVTYSPFVAGAKEQVWTFLTAS